LLSDSHARTARSYGFLQTSIVPTLPQKKSTSNICGSSRIYNVWLYQLSSPQPCGAPLCPFPTTAPPPVSPSEHSMGNSPLLTPHFFTLHSFTSLHFLLTPLTPHSPSLQPCVTSPRVLLSLSDNCLPTQ
jgi:hypothetical protein